MYPFSCRPTRIVRGSSLSSNDENGRIRWYLGEGQFIDGPLGAFGARAVVEIPEMQKLMQHVCKHGFEHHVAVSASQSADILAEAFATYPGWDVHLHRG
jgi:L-fucose isomerase-like protein